LEKMVCFASLFFASSLVLGWVDYSFSENGLVAYKSGQLIHSQSISKELSDENLKELINFVLHYIADLEIPIKR
jgi:phosphomannomutase